MILDSIILENFGVYKGRQEAILTPKEGKPIILFGGMNGGGKTTLLDAIQLAFYGPKARISNRGKLAYKEYLRDSIHRDSDSGKGAGIILCFRRMIDGQFRNFELHRYWREGAKGIEETVRVLRDGLQEETLTEHWDEEIEAYLPNGIAHLFFFDGEQIKDLAEGGHAAEILGAAVHSLLGLDLVDRLEVDLKVLERRKKSENLDREATLQLAQVREELAHIDQEQGKVAVEEGDLVNRSGRLGEKLRIKEASFLAEGGDLYQRRNELASKLDSLKNQKKETGVRFRDLVAGPLPLLLVEELLGEIETTVRHETEVRRARVLLDALEDRDTGVLSALKAMQLGVVATRKIARILEDDRNDRASLASESLILDAEDTLAPHLVHLRGGVLPAARQQAADFSSSLTDLDEKIARVEAELERVPSEDRIAVAQKELDDARKADAEKRAELEALLIRKQALHRQRSATEIRMNRFGNSDQDLRLAEDDRHRILKHSEKVRETLSRFRLKVVQRHTVNIESLMLESFRRLLRKPDLVIGLTIDPSTFEVTLTGTDGKILPFDRLSAGERQLLATSLLWGLARASGRPIPTIIDTPLGRLDSSHRKHMTERYFPNASHQVLLLSTDEEIVGPYLKELKPYITRMYLLEHDEKNGQTNIKEGYFNI